MSSWKHAEKRAAEALGWRRIIRKNFGEDSPDLTEHPILGVEVKRRKKISSFLIEGLAQARRYGKDKLATLIIYEKGRHDGVVVMSLSDFKKLLELIGQTKQPESDSNSLDGVLEITQDENGKFKIMVKQ